MDLSRTLDWAGDRTHGVLVTLRADGRAQSSDVVFAVLDGHICISVTDDRAKTRNMRRDDRVVFHITDPATWTYASIDATAHLSAVAARPDDEVVEELAAVYRRVAGGDHPDWEDFGRAMVEERRLVVRLRPHAATGRTG